jgi:hypothetical protein
MWQKKFKSPTGEDETSKNYHFPMNWVQDVKTTLYTGFFFFDCSPTSCSSMKLKPLLAGSGCCAAGDAAGISTGAGTPPGAVISSADGGGGAAGAALSAGALGGIVSCAGMLPAFPCSNVDDGMLLA